MCDTRRVVPQDLGVEELISLLLVVGESGGNLELPRSGQRGMCLREPEYLPPVRMPPAPAVRGLEGGPQDETNSGTSARTRRVDDPVVGAAK